MILTQEAQVVSPSGSKFQQIIAFAAGLMATGMLAVTVIAFG